ncbi:MAG: hypothetical protein AAF741_10170 [Bacteroidota bacterium]
MKAYLFIFCILVIACQAEPSEIEATNFILPVSEIRYEETNGILRAITSLNTGDSLPVATTYEPLPNVSPLFLNSPMQIRPADKRWVERRVIKWSDELSLAIPRPAETDEKERIKFNVFMPAPYIDSLPARIDLSKGTHFEYGDEPLEEGESLLIFFETREWDPGIKRILIAGPTRDATARLPPKTLRELRAGNYELYLVKQKLSRDTVEDMRASTQIEYFTKSKQVEVY